MVYMQNVSIVPEKGGDPREELQRTAGVWCQSKHTLQNAFPDSPRPS